MTPQASFVRCFYLTVHLFMAIFFCLVTLGFTSHCGSYVMENEESVGL